MIDKILRKIYKDKCMTANELILLTVNIKEPVSKVVLANDDDKCKARIYFQNDASHCVCEIIPN